MVFEASREKDHGRRCTGKSLDDQDIFLLCKILKLFGGSLIAFNRVTHAMIYSVYKIKMYNFVLKFKNR